MAAEASRLTVVEHDAWLAAEDDASAAALHDASRRPRGDASRPGGTRRLCVWCRGPIIPGRARRDAVCCSVRCRQARHRFLRAVGRAEAVAHGHPLRLAYADPPYPGKAWLYRDHPDYGGEVDHAALIERLAGYDGVGAVDVGRGAARGAGAVPAGCPGRRLAPR